MGTGTYFYESPGWGAPCAEHASQLFRLGGLDPLFVLPGFDGEVEDDDVYGGSAVDGVAEGCLVFFVVFQRLARARSRLSLLIVTNFTFAAHEEGILGELLPELLHRFFHGYQSSVRDRAGVGGLGGFFPEQVCANGAVDAIGANHCVRRRRRAVFEMDPDWAVVLALFQRLDPFVEVGLLRGNAFHELIEEVRSVDALLAGCVELGVDEFPFVFAFALYVLVERYLVFSIQVAVSLLRKKKTMIEDDDDDDDGALTTTKFAIVFACFAHMLPVACLSYAARASGPMSARARCALGAMPTPAPISPNVGAAS